MSRGETDNFLEVKVLNQQLLNQTPMEGVKEQLEINEKTMFTPNLKESQKKITFADEIFGNKYFDDEVSQNNEKSNEIENKNIVQKPDTPQQPLPDVSSLFKFDMDLFKDLVQNLNQKIEQQHSKLKTIDGVQQLQEDKLMKVKNKFNDKITQTNTRIQNQAQKIQKFNEMLAQKLKEVIELQNDQQLKDNQNQELKQNEQALFQKFKDETLYRFKELENNLTKKIEESEKQIKEVPVMIQEKEQENNEIIVPQNNIAIDPPSQAINQDEITELVNRLIQEKIQAMKENGEFLQNTIINQQVQEEINEKKDSQEHIIQQTPSDIKVIENNKEIKKEKPQSFSQKKSESPMDMIELTDEEKIPEIILPDPHTDDNDLVHNIIIGLKKFSKDFMKLQNDQLKRIKHLQLSMIHNESMDSKQQEQIDVLEQNISNLHKVVSGNQQDKGSARIEELAMQGLGIDAGTLLQAMKELRLDLSSKIIDSEDAMLKKFKTQTDTLEDSLQELKQKINGFQDQFKNIKLQMEEEQLALDEKFAKQRKLIDNKIELQYFDSEVEDITKMINELSNLQSNTTQNASIMNEMKEIQEKKKEKRQSQIEQNKPMVNSEQMNEIENILKDWPQAQRKLKTLTKQIEELTNTVNRNEGGDQIMHQVKKDLKRLESDIMSKLGDDANPKKLAQQFDVLQKEFHLFQNKNEHQMFDHFDKIMSNQKKIEWLDSQVHAIKQRITDVQRQSKDNAQQLFSNLKIGNQNQDNYEYMDAFNEQLEKVGQNLIQIQDEFKAYKQLSEIEMLKIRNKVEIEKINDLEEILDRKFKLIQKDLNIKDKKIERLNKIQKEAAAGGNSDRSPSKDDKIEALHSTALVPKLPFIKQGELISKFGSGYSKILRNSPVINPIYQPGISPIYSNIVPTSTQNIGIQNRIDSQQSPLQIHQQNQNFQKERMTPINQERDRSQQRNRYEGKNKRSNSNFREGIQPVYQLDQNYIQNQNINNGTFQKHHSSLRVTSNPTLVNHLKARKDFMNIQQDFNNAQMNSPGLWRPLKQGQSIKKIASKSNSLSQFKNNNTNEGSNDNVYDASQNMNFQAQQTQNYYIQQEVLQGIQNQLTHGFLPDIKSPMGNINNINFINVESTQNLHIPGGGLLFKQQQTTDLTTTHQSQGIEYGLQSQYLAGQNSQAQVNVGSGIYAPYPSNLGAVSPTIVLQPFQQLENSSGMMNVGITGMRKEIQMKLRKAGDSKEKSHNNTTGSETTARFAKQKQNKDQQISTSNKVQTFIKKPVLNINQTQENSEELTNDMQSQHLDAARIGRHGSRIDYNYQEQSGRVSHAVGTNLPSQYDIDIKDSNKDLGGIISPNNFKGRNQIDLQEKSGGAQSLNLLANMQSEVGFTQISNENEKD